MSQSISKSIKVSVIVPVYKVERYLAVCLDSLMAQSMQSIEILLVDDDRRMSAAGSVMSML